VSTRGVEDRIKKILTCPEDMDEVTFREDTRQRIVEIKYLKEYMGEQPVHMDKEPATFTITIDKDINITLNSWRLHTYQYKGTTYAIIGGVISPETLKDHPFLEGDDILDKAYSDGFLPYYFVPKDSNYKRFADLTDYEIKAILKDKNPPSIIARKYNVRPHTIHYIKKNKRSHKKKYTLTKEQEQEIAYSNMSNIKLAKIYKVSASKISIIKRKYNITRPNKMS